LKYRYGNGHFWCKGYFVSTVGINEATIIKYIREQEERDKISDQHSLIKLKDPFMGSWEAAQKSEHALFRVC